MQLTRSLLHVASCSLLGAAFYACGSGATPDTVPGDAAAPATADASQPRASDASVGDGTGATDAPVFAGDAPRLDASDGGARDAAVCVATPLALSCDGGSGDASLDAGDAAGDAGCTGGWCVGYDTSGVSFNAVWAGGAEVWAVGSSGNMAHFDGNAWSCCGWGYGDSGFPISNPLYGVWGSKPTDVWAVGQSSLLHWDGNVWVDETPQNTFLYSVWGNAANDVWAVGSGGQVAHWDGTAWQNVPSGAFGALYAVSGRGAGDVWAVGDTGTAIHWNGHAWSSAGAGLESVATLRGVATLGPANAWAVEEGGDVVHWDGCTWSKVASFPGSFLRAIWARSATDIWAVGQGVGAFLHWDGCTWSAVQAPSLGAKSLWSAAGRLWVSGQDLILEHDL
jgi:hypothetical protein